LKIYNKFLNDKIWR